MGRLESGSGVFIEFKKQVMKNYLIIGVILMLTGVLLGAFGAHSLKEVISEEKLISFETGVRYQMIHGIAFLLLVGLNKALEGFQVKNSTLFLMTLGVLLFSGSIYLLALQEVFGVGLTFLWPITPLGGLMIIVSWGLVLYSVIRWKE